MYDVLVISYLKIECVLCYSVVPQQTKGCVGYGICEKVIRAWSYVLAVLLLKSSDQRPEFATHSNI